ncbi:MAG: hypothetical protein ACKPKO_19440, partial [Candidatus Fonsibacter sp.]
RLFIDTALTIHGRVGEPRRGQDALGHGQPAKGRESFQLRATLAGFLSPSAGTIRNTSRGVLEHIGHMVCAPAVDKADSSEFTADALRGNSETSNRGLVDVIRPKKDSKNKSIGPPLPQAADPTRVPQGLRLAVRGQDTPQGPRSAQGLNAS